MTPVDVRSELVAALQFDLVGPQNGNGDAAETLPQHPSRWYLTGFLVPFDTGESQANDEDAADDIEGAGERGGTDDDTAPEKAAASKTRFPSSMGLSILLPTEASQQTGGIRLLCHSQGRIGASATVHPQAAASCRSVAQAARSPSSDTAPESRRLLPFCKSSAQLFASAASHATGINQRLKVAARREPTF